MGPTPLRAEPITVTAVPVVLDPADLSATRIGKLRFRGGLQLTSPDERFGGLSALGLSADGKRMVAISDMGVRFAARPIYDTKGNLANVTGWDLAPLTGPDGTALRGKFFTDAEAMSPGVDGEIIVAFERDHRIWRYLAGDAVPRPIPRPVELANIIPNAGIEALTLLDDGRLLAITEGLVLTGDSVGWVSDPAGWSVLTYATDGGFRPTGAATLPSGDVLVLERYFSARGSLRTRIKRVEAASVAPAARLQGTTLAEWGMKKTIDNFEGIEVISGSRGETLIYIVSDDNFSTDQRTLLMMFELED